MIKKIIENLSNPLLYYVEKDGTSVFRNFCFLKNTGNFYRISIPKPNAGKALEYRFELDKVLKRVQILTPIVLYFIFIHLNFSIWLLLLFEILWLGIVLGVRIYCSSLYSKFLISHFGKYELVEFEPPVTKSKKDEFTSLFYSKVVAVIILLGLFCVPAVGIQWRIKANLVSKKPNYTHAVKLANGFFMLYPKVQKVYDMRACAKFMTRDYEGALADYKKVLELSGKRFSKRDYTRFENLLLVQKKVSTPQDAVDTFNEYVTEKKLSILEASQMLWIKSIFKIENNIPDTISQEYDDLLTSLDEKDTENQFYITSDKAYMLYLMQEYFDAINIYNALITYAQAHDKRYAKELKSLYVERGFARKRLGDDDGANSDFALSGIESSDLSDYEPSYSAQKFVVAKF